MRKLRAVVVGLMLSGPVSMALAQSSPNYVITGSSVVTMAGEASSEQYEASLIGGDGSPSGSASSPEYAVVFGAGDPDPVNAERIFSSGFEP